jgi:hypothetical protein
MKALLRGVIRGKIIELTQESGLPEGQQVDVSLRVVPPRLPAGEGLRSSAGAWADDAAGLDEYLEWSRQQRKTSRPELNS